MCYVLTARNASGTTVSVSEQDLRASEGGAEAAALQEGTLKGHQSQHSTDMASILPALERRLWRRTDPLKEVLQRLWGFSSAKQMQFKLCSC